MAAAPTCLLRQLYCSKHRHQLSKEQTHGGAATATGPEALPCTEPAAFAFCVLFLRNHFQNRLKVPGTLFGASFSWGVSRGKERVHCVAVRAAGKGEGSWTLRARCPYSQCPAPQTPPSPASLSAFLPGLFLQGCHACLSLCLRLLGRCTASSEGL